LKGSRATADIASIGLFRQQKKFTKPKLIRLLGLFNPTKLESRRKMKFLRTPDEGFTDLSGYNFTPN
jgi:hypothetical protein